jgi:hypothetical protein
MLIITIPKYVPTVNRAIFKDLDITYELVTKPFHRNELVQEVRIDEVFVGGANITSLLSSCSKKDITDTVSIMLKLRK